MTVLGPHGFAHQLDQAVSLLTELSGRRPVGYRAPNLVYEPWATRILEARGFLYDATVCSSRPLGGKYRGWLKAPMHPYRTSYEDIAQPGTARLIEIPLPSFPVVKVAAGSGILTRVFGFYWTFIALRAAIRQGDTSFYLHPWEVGPRPCPDGQWLRNAVFLRHTGPWMLHKLDRILRHFHGHIVTSSEAASTIIDATGAQRRVA